MKKRLLLFLTFPALLFAISSCSENQSEETLLNNSANSVESDNSNDEGGEGKNPEATNLHYLALGDSYTLGTGVSEEDSFPRQLTTSLEAQLNTKIDLELLAANGWRTDNLLSQLPELNREAYDLATLMIGVNNQFQGLDDSQFTSEFSKLLDTIIALTSNRPERVVVISIPDYTYSPFGRIYASEEVSAQIDRWNNFAASYSEQTGSYFIDVTDISRMGLENPELIASDALHLSGLAYSQLVGRILPVAYAELSN
ncbi:MAG: SGNH/GDSL hydrolase family protein [Bacteroidota bacterium]